MARRYRRRDSGLNIERVFKLILVLVVLSLLYNLSIWLENNWRLLVVCGLVIAAVGLGGYFLYLQYKKKKKVDLDASFSEDVIKMRSLLESFIFEIPKGSRHSEALYQTDLGRYLKGEMTGDKVEYEKSILDTRPDIVVNDNIAIEVKAMKPPSTPMNKEYNYKHIESIYKKSDLYPKQFQHTIFVIFNSIHEMESSQYKTMKQTLEEKNLLLIEK